MSIFKCKMCGGTIEFEPGDTIGVCDSCGTKQTLPRLDSDRKANLYDRANHFRRNNDFDKAMSIYENILNEDPTDAEAYWSIVLCRYGIEYVEDPATRRRVPTVNRAQYTSIFDDEDYKSALKNADVLQRSLYEDEAKAINEIQKGILEISTKEEPFDVFICYKETDANGRRTPDSVLATDLYHQLTNEGFKVFFSRITLEDKLGQEYEPYIFAALNSAKAMVVLGTKPEHFNAVWVKNEWSRYLALIKAGAKKTLIPAYRDMDPYDLPDEFSHLQAQDMSKLGFMQDLIRGIKKITQKNELYSGSSASTAENTVTTNTVPLVKRLFMFLEDGDWNSANVYSEKILDIDPENAHAWLGKLMSFLKVSRSEDLHNQSQPFDGDKYCLKVMRFGDEVLKKQIQDANEYIRQRSIVEQAVVMIEKASTIDECEEAKRLLSSLSDYEGIQEKIASCDERIKQITLRENAKEEIDNLRKKYEIISQAYEHGKKEEASAGLALQNIISTLKEEEKALEQHQVELQNLKGLFSKIRREKLEETVTNCQRRIDRINSQKKDAEERYAKIIQSMIPLSDLKECTYKIASAYMLVGDYKLAFKEFEKITGYKDVDEKLKTDANLLNVAPVVQTIRCHLCLKQ